MASMTKTTLGTLGGLALALGLTACGGSNDPCSNPAAPGCSPTASPTPAAVCNRSVVLTEHGSLPAQTEATIAFTTSSAGTLEVTADYTFAASPIGVYVVRGACNLDQFNARSCDFVFRSESGAKPRKVSSPNFAAGSYSLILANFGKVDESLAFQVVLATGSCAPAAEGVGASDLGARDPRFAQPLKGIRPF